MRRATILAALALASCTSPRTQVMVLVEAEAEVRLYTRDVEIRIWGGPNVSELSDRPPFTITNPQFPIRVPIVPENNDASRVFRIEAVALDDDGDPIAVTRATSGFVEGRTLALTIVLYDSCIDVDCSTLESTCGEAGGCVPNDVEAGSLPDYEDPGRTDAGPVPSECGDGFVDPDEECDDGNDVAGDGCSPSCEREFFCGNTMVEAGEFCDDGDANGTYGNCNGDCSAILECGDGIVTSPDEECEPGLGPDCSNNCRLVVPGCGDGNVGAGEECDDGDTDPCDGCSPECLLEVCGNGRIDCGEVCDNGIAGSVCTCGPGTSCTPAECALPRCGDGNVDAALGEECDDGNTTSCDATMCSGLCELEACGNGRVECGEMCDRGAGFGCFTAADCAVGDVCGDFSLGPTEECDDGNGASCDGCDGMCRAESCGNGRIDCGEDCDPPGLPGPGGAMCNAMCRFIGGAPVCGDGRNDAGEVCYGAAMSRLIDTSPSWEYIIAADIDTDGNPDVVLSRPSEYWWMAGRGTGEFGLAGMIGTSSPVAGRMIAVDVDGDFVSDLVAESVFCPSPCMTALPFDELLGNFRSTASASLPSRPADLHAGQLDARAGLDIVMAYTFGSRDGAIWVNDWPPSSLQEFDTFAPFITQVAAVPRPPAGGNPLVVVFNQMVREVLAYRVIPPSVALEAGPFWSYALPSDTVDIVVGGLVGGGDPSIVVVGSGGGPGMEVRTYSPAGTFMAMSGWGRPEQVVQAELAFVDGDANVDLVVATREGRILVGLGDGNGLFGPTPAVFDTFCGSIGSMAIADFDRSGALDVAYTTSSCPPTVVLANP